MQYGDYTIVRYTPEFRDALLDLLSLLWGDDKPNNSAYFKWKYDQNPYADRHWIYLALYDGKPVAVRGNFAMQWQAGDPCHLMNCLCDADAVVLPEHRRKGLLEIMTKLNLENAEEAAYRYIVTLSANEKSGANNLKLGWKPIALTKTFIRVKPVHITVKSKFQNLVRRIPLAHRGYTALRRMLELPAPSSSLPPEVKAPFDVLDSQRTKIKGNYRQLSIEEAARPQEMADLITRLPVDRRMRHVRDAQYFAWRYLNPRSSYRFLFWGEQILEGYLILHTPARPGTHAVSIVDWEAVDPAVRVKLLQAAIEMGDFEALKTWGISLSEQSIELLLQEGFLPENGDLDQENYQPQVLLRPAALQPQEADWQVANMDLLDLHNWDIRPVYSDTF